jgi:hypothetical protein
MSGAGRPICSRRHSQEGTGGAAPIRWGIVHTRTRLSFVRQNVTIRHLYYAVWMRQRSVPDVHCSLSPRYARSTVSVTNHCRPTSLPGRLPDAKSGLTARGFSFRSGTRSGTVKVVPGQSFPNMPRSRGTWHYFGIGSPWSKNAFSASLWMRHDLPSFRLVTVHWRGTGEMWAKKSAMPLLQ